MSFLLLQLLDEPLLQFFEVGNFSTLLPMFGRVFGLLLLVAAEVVDDEVVAARFGDLGRRLEVIVVHEGREVLPILQVFVVALLLGLLEPLPLLGLDLPQHLYVHEPRSRLSSHDMLLHRKRLALLGLLEETGVGLEVLEEKLVLFLGCLESG